jgi:hypothetical protein
MREEDVSPWNPWLEGARAEVSGERALEALGALTQFHRIQSSPGYDAASSWMAEALERAGLRVELSHAEGDGRTRHLGVLMPEGWVCDHATATLHHGRATERLCDHATLELSLIQRSAPAAGTYPLVAVDDGTQDAHYEGLDVRGRVVLTRGAVHRVLELAVRDRGAAGILFDGRRELPPVRGPLDDPDAVTYTSFWWNGEEPRGWGFVVSPGTGARLRAKLGTGAPLALEVRIESRAFATRIPLLSGVLPGRTEREVLIVSHLCHPRPSANDNASGAAANLEAARVLGRLARGAGPGERSVRFLFVPEMTGSCAWLGLDPERSPRIDAALNLDMVGEDQEKCGSTFLLEHPPCFSGSFAEPLLGHMRERSQDWVTSYSGPGHYSLARMAEVPYSGGSDHSIFIDRSIGVPCPMLIQWPDRYYHSSHDTPDKSDPRSLALAARAAVAYAGFLSHAAEPELEVLERLVAWRARRRLLATAEAAAPGRAIESERRRGHAALRSLGRLGAGAGTLRAASEALDAFCLREGLSRHDDVLRPGAQAAGERRPRRLTAGPLEWLRHLLPGWSALPRASREEFLRFESALPTGFLDLAWSAASGRETVEEIARDVWLETGHHDPEAIDRLFGWTARLGLSTSGDED